MAVSAILVSSQVSLGPSTPNSVTELVAARTSGYSPVDEDQVVC
jgi:hypothetical protein